MNILFRLLNRAPQIGWNSLFALGRRQSGERSLRPLGLMVSLVWVLGACIDSDTAAYNPASIGLIPEPQEMRVQAGTLAIDESIPIAATSPEAQRVASYFVEQVHHATGKKLVIGPVGAGPSIRFELLPTQSSDPEAYTLAVDSQGMHISAETETGLFYGAVTAWQLLTPWDDNQTQHALPFMHISDEPAYEWRGLLLDSARHMQSTEFIKSLIDWMALHKLNVLHWHLTDDQGWRIEIKAYPLLTAKGGWRVPAGEAAQTDIDPATGKPRLYGGYYSQDEIREIVAYAQSRHITIVPEIDIPGHALAAMVSYPELGVVEAPEAVMADWGVYPYLFNPADTTFDFLDTVLGEVTTLFPSEYIHVGGDEAPKHQWRASDDVQALMASLGIEDEDALQGYFTARLESILKTYNRRLVGWDEIAEGGLAENAVVMSWRGLEGAILAAEHGHQSIIAPNSHLYLDYRQSGLDDEPPGRGRQITMRDIYEFDFLAEAANAPELKKSVLGIQANLWTEHMRTETRVAHMAFPRLMAVSELAWRAPEARNFDAFANRVGLMMLRYQTIGLPYADSMVRPVLDTDWTLDPENQITVALTRQVEIGEVRYTVDGSNVTPTSPNLSGPLHLAPGTQLKAASFFQHRRISDQIAWQISPDEKWKFRETDLETCTDALVLHLEDDAPLDGQRPNFQVDIMNPCWMLRNADLSGIDGIELKVGQVPYNFQLMDDIHNVVTYPAPEAGPVFEIRAGTCLGTVVGSAPIVRDETNYALTTIQADLSPGNWGVGDLCILPRTGQLDPLWVIDSGRLIPRGAGSQ